MPTFTAFTTLADEAAARALGDALERLVPEPIGVGVLAIEDRSGRWEAGGYFTEAPDGVALALLAASRGARPFAVSELPEVDWVAHVERELAPVEAGRFFVYGGHDADKVPPVSVALLIEAAMAFGTGHHATTQGCLLALDRLAASGFVGHNVADIGCGTAVLAMAAAGIWPGPESDTVLAVDIDALAVEVATANVAANGLAGRVRCLEAAGFNHPEIAAAAPFDLVFANIFKGPLIELAPDMSRHVGAGGQVILSGVLNEQAGDLRLAYAAEGFASGEDIVLGDWSTLTMHRRFA